MTDKEVMQMALDTFNKSKKSHYYCEDRFYSCPQHEEGCADDLEGDECNCGANFVNETIDRAIEALRTALAQPKSAECDGGQCGIGGYCKQCPKTQPDVPETAFGETDPVAIKFQIYKQTPQRGRELEPINSALLPWVYDQDPSSGNTASMWVTPVATLPPKKEWVGLTDDEKKAIYEQADAESWHDQPLLEAVEAKLKEKNT